MLPVHWVPGYLAFMTSRPQLESINQSINQSNFYSANIPGVDRLSGTTARSVFRYEVVEAIL